MKLSSIYSLTALAGCAVAEDAYLWTINHGAAKYANTQASSISSETASSIIARRRGILHDEHLAGADASLLRDVKQYEGYQMPIMGTTSDPSPAKVLIRISGYTGTVSQFPSLPDLWVEDATKDLADGFKARENVEGICEYNLQIPTKNGVDLVYSYNAEGSSCMSIAKLQIQPTILALFSTVPTADDVSKKLHGLMRTLSHLSVTGNLESTLLILPPTSKLQKAQSGRRADTPEEPLEFSIAASKTSSTLATATGKPRNETHPLPHIVPQCFSSLATCHESTNLCSGHGSCYKAHTNCFKCKCGSTVVRVNADGTKKTVQWGGNACQKKDISTEFVLFASLAVALTAIVAGAIGAMYTMGSQELPSVLGAGVGGAKPQK